MIIKISSEDNESEKWDNLGDRRKKRLYKFCYSTF